MRLEFVETFRRLEVVPRLLEPQNNKGGKRQKHGGCPIEDDQVSNESEHDDSTQNCCNNASAHLRISQPLAPVPLAVLTLTNDSSDLDRKYADCGRVPIVERRHFS